MFNLLTEAKEAVTQKNRNLSLISQQHQILAGLEEKVRASRKELVETKKKLENYNSRTGTAADKMAVIELALKKKQTELYLLDQEISKKKDMEKRLNADLKLLKENLSLTELEIEEKELILKGIEKELAKSPEVKKQEEINRVLSVLEQCVLLKERSEKYYTF